MTDRSLMWHTRDIFSNQFPEARSVLLFEQGQRPLLEFLRNLTPQVLLASTSLLFGVRIDFGRFDFSNWMNTLAFFTCAGLGVLAFFANFNQYLDALLDNLGGYGRIARRLRRRGVMRRKAALASLQVMLKAQPTLFLDFLGTVAIVNGALLATAVAALNAARSALR